MFYKVSGTHFRPIEKRQCFPSPLSMSKKHRFYNGFLTPRKAIEKRQCFPSLLGGAENDQYEPSPVDTAEKHPKIAPVLGKYAHCPGPESSKNDRFYEAF